MSRAVDCPDCLSTSRQECRPGRKSADGERRRTLGGGIRPAAGSQGHPAGDAGGRQGQVHPLGDRIEHDGAGRADRSGDVRMTRTKAQKQEIVTALAAKLKRAPTLYVTDFTGLNVARITDLRRRLRAAGIEYVVVKNTLALRALSEAQLAGGER